MPEPAKRLALASCVVVALLALTWRMMSSTHDGAGALAAPEQSDRGVDDAGAETVKRVDSAPGEARVPATEATLLEVEAETQPSDSEPPQPERHRYAVVTSRPTGRPIEGAALGPTVTERDTVVASELPPAIAQADRDGRIAAPDAERDEAFLFHAKGHAPVIATLGPLHRDPARALEVVLPAPGALAGTLTLVGADAGRDSTGLVVVLRAKHGDVTSPPSRPLFGGSVEWRRAVDDDGRFRLDDVVPGIPLEAEVRAGDEVLWSPGEQLLLVEGATTHVTWEFGHAAVVRARFLEPEAGPARELEVYLDVAPKDGVRYMRSLSPRARRSRTGSDGVATFENVREGRWCVGIAAVAGPSGPESPAPSLVRFEVVRGTSSVDLDVPVHRGLYIDGVVQDSTGALVQESVFATGEEGGTLLARSDDKGRFQVGPMLPGAYSLQAVPFGQGENLPGPPVRALAGDRDIVVQMRRGAVVAGVVVEAASGARLSASVSQTSTGGGGYTCHATSGVFEFEGVAPGSASLRVHTSDGRVMVVAPFDVAPGDRVRDLVVRVQDATYLEVHALGRHERVSVTVSQEGVQWDSQWISRGASARLPVQPGKFELRATIPGPDDTSTLVEEASGMIAAGAVERIDLLR